MKKQEAVAYCEERIKNAKPGDITKDLYTAVLGLVNGGFVDAAIQGWDGKEHFIVYGEKDAESGEREILTNQIVDESFEFFKDVCSEVGELVTKTPTSTHWWILKLDEE